MLCYGVTFITSLLVLLRDLLILQYCYCCNINFVFGCQKLNVFFAVASTTKEPEKEPFITAAATTQHNVTGVGGMLLTVSNLLFY